MGGRGVVVVNVCVLFRSPEFGEDSSGVACPISAIQFSVLFLGGIFNDFQQPIFRLENVCSHGVPRRYENGS